MGLSVDASGLKSELSAADMAYLLQHADEAKVLSDKLSALDAGIKAKIETLGQVDEIRDLRTQAAADRDKAQADVANAAATLSEAKEQAGRIINAANASAQMTGQQADAKAAATVAEADSRKREADATLAAAQSKLQEATAREATAAAARNEALAKGADADKLKARYEKRHAALAAAMEES